MQFAAFGKILMALGAMFFVLGAIVFVGSRFGLGRFTTQAEVDYAAHRVVDTVRQLREL